jgi:DNA-binding NarL/FixJ family response regulator
MTQDPYLDGADLHVLVVADDALARAGLAALLAAQDECAVSGEVPGDADLELALEVYAPDVVVWDLGWDPAPALERLAELEGADPPLVALLPEETLVGAAWAAGARGILPREVAVERLVAALRAVVQGLIVLDPTLAEALQLPQGDLTSESLIEELTPRELEVVQLLAEGLSNKAIAYQLDISEHTVKFHVNAIMGKLGAQSRTEAAVRATRMGLILL